MRCLLSAVNIFKGPDLTNSNVVVFLPNLAEADIFFLVPRATAFNSLFVKTTFELVKSWPLNIFTGYSTSARSKIENHGKGKWYKNQDWSLKKRHTLFWHTKCCFWTHPLIVLEHCHLRGVWKQYFWEDCIGVDYCRFKLNSFNFILNTSQTRAFHRAKYYV